METAGNKDFDSETEKKGLGTPATRAGIIEKLVSSGYAVRKGKQILPSTEGRELVNVMPAYLKSAAMTYQVYRYVGYGPLKSLFFFASYALHGIWKYR